jgi:ABC-type sugar transport system ATPase subunit
VLTDTVSTSAPAPHLIELRCAGDAAPLHIAPGSGRSYRVTARNEAILSRLVREALNCPAAELVPRSGGLLSNLSVLENIVLPGVYHRRVATAGIAERVYEVFAACELDRSQAEALCERAVPDLDAFERRLVMVARSLLMRPAVLLMERIFEGLTARDMERVAGFGGFYRRAVAGGTVVYFDLAGMPCPEIAADVFVEAE